MWFIEKKKHVKESRQYKEPILRWRKERTQRKRRLSLLDPNLKRRGGEGLPTWDATGAGSQPHDERARSCWLCARVNVAVVEVILVGRIARSPDHERIHIDAVAGEDRRGDVAGSDRGDERTSWLNPRGKGLPPRPINRTRPHMTIREEGTASTGEGWAATTTSWEGGRMELVGKGTTPTLGRGHAHRRCGK